MAIQYVAYRKNPWVLTWRDAWTKKRRSKAFTDEHSAQQFEAVQAALAAREKELIQRANRQKAAKHKILLADLLTRYVASLSAPISRISSAYHIRPLIDVYGARQAARLTCAEVVAFMELQRGRGVGDTTIVRRVSILRAALRWGVQGFLLESNPIAELRLPPAKSQRFAPPTPHEARMIMHCAAPHIQRVIVLGMATGARIGPSELFRLRWSDVDTSLGMIRMPTAAKGSPQAARDVPVRPDVLPMLKLWQKHDADARCPYVINYGGAVVQSISRGWRAALRRAGITRRIRPYDLRHAFASWALAGGADPGSVAEIMAHRPSMLFDVYQHVTQKQKVVAVKAAPSILGKGAVVGVQKNSIDLVYPQQYLLV